MSSIPINQNASHTYFHQLSGLEARPNQKVDIFRHDRQRAKRAASEQPIFSSFCTSAIDPLKESLQEKKSSSESVDKGWYYFVANQARKVIRQRVPKRLESVIEYERSRARKDFQRFCMEHQISQNQSAIYVLGRKVDQLSSTFMLLWFVWEYNDKKWWRPTAQETPTSSPTTLFLIEYPVRGGYFTSGKRPRKFYS